MDAVIMLALRIGLLALLWIFILVALKAMRRDTNKSAGAIRQQSKKVGAPRRREAIKQLSIVEGPLQGSHMELGTLEDCTLGRASDCDFVTGDDYSSGHHARLFRRGSEVGRGRFGISQWHLCQWRAHRPTRGSRRGLRN